MGTKMLIGDYKIESDAINIVVSKRLIVRKGDNAGKESWTNQAYVSTLENALKYLVNQEVKETGLTDLKTVIAKQNELYELIKGVK